MLTHILHNSETLCTFIDQLGLDLSQPQQRHLRNLVDALLVCESRKTLAALRRQLVEGGDVSNMADYLRISPWNAPAVRQAVGAWMVRWAIQQAEQVDAPKRIYVNLDDSIAVKHKQTRHLAGVDWHYDHLESTKHQPRFKNGLAFLVCTVAAGRLVVTFDVPLYLRERTVCGLKSKRKLNGKRLDQHASALWHQRYTPVTVTAADGAKTTYLVRAFSGRLEDLAFDVRVFASKRHS